MEKLLNLFRGRATRLRFWVVLGIVAPSCVALIGAFYSYALSFPGAYENGGPTPWPTSSLGIAGMVMWFAAWFAIFIAFISIAVRRLHDRDKTWWWVLVFVIVPNALTGFAQAQIATNGGVNVSEAILLLDYAGFGLFVWGLVEMGFLRGTAGDNRFGTDPLAP